MKKNQLVVLSFGIVLISVSESTLAGNVPSFLLGRTPIVFGDAALIAGSILALIISLSIFRHIRKSK